MMLFKTIPSMDTEDKEKKEADSKEEEEIDIADLGSYIATQRQKNRNRKR